MTKNNDSKQKQCIEFYFGMQSSNKGINSKTPGPNMNYNQSEITIVQVKINPLDTFLTDISPK